MSLSSPLASPTEASFRPEDKALDMLFPSAEDPLTESFSQYVNEELFDISDADKEFHFLEDIVDLFDKDSYTNGGSYLGPIGSSARQIQSSPQPWRKGLWCLNGTSSSQAQAQTENQRRTSLERSTKAVPTSCIGVASLGVIEQPCSSGSFGQTPPPSQSSSPLHCETKKIIITPRLGSNRPRPNKRLELDRSNSLSPTPVTATDQLKTNMAYQEPWHNTQQALQNFSFGPQDETQPTTPPLSGRVAQPTNMASVIQNSAVMPLGMLGSPHQYASHDSQLIGQDYNPQGFIVPPSTVPMIPDSDQQPIPTWSSDTYEPQNSTDFPYPMTGSGPSSTESQVWWPQPQTHETSSHVPNPQQSYYPLLAAPVPHRPAHGLLQHGPNLQSGGLMIQCPEPSSPEISSPQTFSPSSFSPNTGPGFSPSSAYPQPAQHGQRFAQRADHFSTPQRTSRQKQHTRQQRAPSPSCSPSLSPTSTSRRDRSHSYSHRRNSHERNSRRQKSSSHSISSVSKTPRTPRTPKSATSSGGTIFYNLTQGNSKEILEGVAPSGSSKTREKRRAQEKERDRQRYEEMELERRKSEALEKRVKALARDTPVGVKSEKKGYVGPSRNEDERKV